jgi:outer membrane receptor protein involved in Fe transport
MPAATIQKIEIITNPPSKYDAEGLAGIINIVLNKKVKDGFTGSITLNQGFPTAGTGIGTSFSMKQKKLGITVFGGGNQNQTPQIDFETSQQSNLNGLFQKGTKANESKSAYLGAEISYEIDSLNLVTTQLNSYGSWSNGDSFQNTVLNNRATRVQGYDANNANNGRGSGFDAAINYELGFKKDKKRLLTFSARHAQYENNQNNAVTFSNLFNFLAPNYKQENIGKNTEETVQIDYVRPIKKVRMELGVKGIFRKNSSDFTNSIYNNTTRMFEKEANRSDQFDNSQNIFAFYNSYQFSLKSWNFQTGFRIEETQIRADFFSSSTLAQQNYLNIVPSVAIQKGFENENSINIGFNQRIKRPGINRLNPFVDRSNPNFVTTGNPNLRPVANNDIQLGYSIAKKIAVDISMGYSFSKNIDLKVSTFDAANNITLTTYQNTGKASRLGLDFNVNYAKVKNLKLALNGNLAHFNIQGFEGTTFIQNNVLTYYFAFSSGYRFAKGWKVNASANLISQNPTGLQGVSNALVSSSLSCNKELLKEKLYLSAYINNPFTKFRNNRTDASGSNFIQITNNQEFFRTFGFSLNYQFGRLSNEIKKNKREINNNDVSN